VSIPPRVRLSRTRSIERPPLRWPASWPRPPRLRPEIWLIIIVGTSLVIIGLIAVVRSGDSFDRSGAVTRAAEDSAGRLTQEQAECYVDGVHDQLGGRYLAPDASVPDDIAARMTSIRVDCVGLANLGVPSTLDPESAGVISTPPTEAGNLPREKGDDPTLDALYDQCASGSGQACDDLFLLSPVRSAYESFAITCGNRTTERRCADVYVLAPPPTTASAPVDPNITAPPVPPPAP
jgi:hypothetical protein